MQPDATNNFYLNRNTANYMTILSAGNVGIGTKTPSNKLSVLGSADISGNLGIGTTTASQRLEVNGNVQITGSSPTLIFNDIDGGGSRPNIYMKGNGLFYFAGDDTPDSSSVNFNFYSKFSSARTYDTTFKIFGKSTSTWGNYIEFTHTGDGGYGEIITDTGGLILAPAGNVGIGTTTPTEKLNVSGNILSTGTMLGSNLSGTNTGDQLAGTNIILSGATFNVALTTGTNITGDHGTDSTDEVVNVCYGTGSSPAASTTTEGALFVKYTA